MALFVTVLLLTGCAARTGPQLYEKQMLFFDTIISLRFYAGENGSELMEHCRQMCEEFEHTFSRTREDSELYRINHRTHQTVEVSEAMAELVTVGLEYYEKSGGKFDITIAPLSDLWDFKSESPSVPAQREIDEALKKIGGEEVHVDGTLLTFEQEDIMLDLGALAKGYAADRLKDYLTAEGVTSGLIDLGGNILTIGNRPDGGKWRVGLQKPFAERGESFETVEVSDQTVVSSGIYERYFEQDGEIYHHILDPDTGYPVKSDIQSVSVICGSSLRGDALSTAGLALGSEEAQKLLSQEKGVRAVLVLENGEIVHIAGESDEETT